MPPLAFTDEKPNSLATLAARRRPARNEVIELKPNFCCVA